MSQFCLLAGQPLALISRLYPTEDEARACVQDLAHAHRRIFVAEIKAEYAAVAVAREVHRADENVLRLSPPR